MRRADRRADLRGVWGERERDRELEGSSLLMLGGGGESGPATGPGLTVGNRSIIVAWCVHGSKALASLIVRCIRFWRCVTWHSASDTCHATVSLHG